VAAIDVTQVVDFTGGINFRADQFQLANNESPGMLNVEIDPRGGVFSRAGYQKKNATAISFDGDWKPKGLYNYKFTGNPQIMLTTAFQDAATPVDGAIYYSSGGNFTYLDSALNTHLAVKSSNGAGMTQWEQTMYFALGRSATQMYKWTNGDTYATALTASGPTWQPYQLPVGGYMPRAELTIAHANKLFVANTYENGTAYKNRLRWSHESSPENWFQDDYIDIIAGGEGIRGLQIVDGQLLIFKPKAIYLLMGYDADSFQLVELTTVLGIDYPQQATAGSGGVYFFDYPNGLYFYDRNGIQDLFSRIRPIILNNEVNSGYTDTITLSFVRNRLWVSMPYRNSLQGSPPDYASVNFIFDPTIGAGGAYMMFQTAPWFTDDTSPAIDGFGLVSGCDWRDENDNPFYLLISPYDAYPHVMAVDDYSYTLDNAPDTFSGFFGTSYTTSWFEDKAYVQLKTFIRPYYVFKEVSQQTIIRLNVYRNYNETNQYGGTRAITLSPINSGSVYSQDGSGGVYVLGPPEGVTPDPLPANAGIYDANVEGATIKRKGVSRLGKGYSIQLEFIGPDDSTDNTNNPGRKWGLNSIAYKFKRRKIRSN